MRKIFSFMLPAMAFICTACSFFGGSSESFSLSAGETGIYIDSDGKVTYSFAEDFGKDYYNKDDLKKIIDDEIDSYNSKNSKSAELDEFEVEDNVARAKLKFDSCDDLISYRTQFEGVAKDELYIGSIKNAVAQDMEIAGEFIKVTDGKTSQEILISREIKKMDSNIVIVHHQTKLEIADAKIEYVSSNCNIDNGVITVKEQNSEHEVAYVVYSK